MKSSKNLIHFLNNISLN